MRRLFLICLALLPLNVSAAQTSSEDACLSRLALPPYRDRPVFLMNDTLLLTTEAIELDIDGSPRAYGVQDQGLDDICNGLAPREPPECHTPGSADCEVACRSAFRGWNGQPEDLSTTMCSVGLGGADCSNPRVRFQSPPAQNWFVSETLVHPAAPPGEDSESWTGRQEAQLDSLQVPYFVIPDGFRKRVWDATPGDVGVVVDADGNVFPFIVGDGGGNLNEGSARLLADMRHVDRLPTSQVSNAFGNPVERLQGSLTGDYSVAIFRHSGRSDPNEPTQLLLTTAQLPAFIQQVAVARLGLIGGASAIRTCSR